MNPDLSALHAYPFEKLAKIKADCQPPEDLSAILLSIGEPKHPAPAFVIDRLKTAMTEIGAYPSTKGSKEFRQTIGQWLSNRFLLPQQCLNPDQNILPVNGTREALFAIAQASINRNQTTPTVLMPNPFYQIYEGAAILAGAEPVYLPCEEENNFLPNFDQVTEQNLKNCQLLYLCSPANPSGAVLTSQQMTHIIELADRYNFIIASDECYSEIYHDDLNPPPSLLQACHDMGREDFSRCIVFHSLSKRSNLPGLRSGFVAGDANIIGPFLKYRTYHGCAMPVPTQLASCEAWRDETHVEENRQRYRDKFTAVEKILGTQIDIELPQAGFYLWLKTPIDDIEFARQLYQQQNVTVLPGQFLSRTIEGRNPGQNRVRIALVARLQECVEAAERIKLFVQSL